VLLCLLCIAAMTAHYFVLGLGIAGALVLALFGTRVLGYLEWGGWTARWYGREETKILHAAAQFAKLKIEQARDDRALLGALAVFAPEISCRRIVLESGAHRRAWTDTLEKIDFDPAEGDTLDMELISAAGPEFAGARLRLTFAGQAALDDERRQLLEDLCRLAGERLEQFSGGMPPQADGL
jgi:hypothetical protein